MIRTYHGMHTTIKGNVAAVRAGEKFSKIRYMKKNPAGNETRLSNKEVNLNNPMLKGKSTKLHITNDKVRKAHFLLF